MSGGITVRELVATLGLDIDEAAFSRADAMLAGLSKSFLAFGTAAVAGVAIALVGLTKSSANAADHIRKLAQSTGVDSIALQEFGYSADLAGVSLDEMAVGLRHLAKTGVKDVRAEVLKLADRFAKMPDDGKKVELAMDKFGRAGARMIPWLNAGAKGIADLAQEAHDLGVIFDEDAQKSSEEFNDNITRLGYGFAGLRNVIGAAVLPTLNRFILATLGFVKYMRANWTPMVNEVLLALRTLAFVLGGIVLAALVTNAAAAASAVGWYVALGVAAAVAGIKAAAAWLLAAAPVAALAALFALLALGIEDVYVFLQGGDSLIGELGPKWTKFLDDFSRPNTEDPWWLAALRKAVYFVTHLYETIPKLMDELEGFVHKVDVGFLGDIDRYAHDKIVNAFGGGASPQASAASSPAPGVHVSAPQLHNNVTIHAAPGQNAQEIADAVTQKLDAHFDAKIRGAARGVTP